MRLSPGDCPPRTIIFSQTLTKTNQARNSEDDRNDDFTSTGPVGLGSSGEAIGEEHAEADIQISDHASIASEGICQQNVTKLAILRLGQTANTDPLEGKEKTDSTGAGGAVERPDQNKEENDVHRLREPVQSLNQFRGSASDYPKDDEPQSKWDSKTCGQAVDGDVMWALRGGCAGRIFDERRDVLEVWESDQPSGIRWLGEGRHSRCWLLPSIEG